jgi:hypothetical protein
VTVAEQRTKAVDDGFAQVRSTALRCSEVSRRTYGKSTEIFSKSLHEVIPVKFAVAWKSEHACGEEAASIKSIANVVSTRKVIRLRAKGEHVGTVQGKDEDARA